MNMQVSESANDNEAPFQDVFYSAPDGLKLHARDYGRKNPANRERLPLICLPGLSRNTRDFHDLAMMIAGDPQSPRRVVSFDYRGRGQSEWAKAAEDYTVITEADDILAGMAALGLEHAIFLGTSRGGLIMHIIAATRPGVISGGILNDIGPVIEGEGLAQIKAYLTRAPKPSDWDDAARIQKEIHGKAFPVLTNQDFLDFARCIYDDVKGSLKPAFDPKLLDGVKAMDFNAPLPTLWPQFDALAADKPIMVLRGEFSSLLSQATVDGMKEKAAHIQTHTAPGQGHAPILHIGALPTLIKIFLEKCDKQEH